MSSNKQIFLNHLEKILPPEMTQNMFDRCVLAIENEIVSEKKSIDEMKKYLVTGWWVYDTIENSKKD